MSIAEPTAPAWPHGIGLDILDEIDSTNAEAARRASAGARVPGWIMARRQVSGRGRRGRAWAMPEGNLAATCLSFPNCAPLIAAQTSFIASLAVADLFAHAAPRAECRVKWPNDVLLNGRKAAGILLESASDGGRVVWLACGIGINLAAAPDAGDLPEGAHIPTSVIAEGGIAITPDDALLHLAAAMHRWQGIHRREGFEAIRLAWLARAARLGEEITARLPNETVNGIFEDVDAEGSLVLRTPTGARVIAAADVYFPGL